MRRLVKTLGAVFLILGVLTAPLALIGAISGSYNLKGPLDGLIDILMRVLFIGTPIGLLISAVGLLRTKKWGRFCALLSSAVLSLVFLTYGILGLGEKGNTIFCSICFVLAFLFGYSIAYLVKTKDQFSS